VRLVPAATGLGAEVFVIARSACAITVVESEVVLSPGFRSVCVDEAFAVFVIVDDPTPPLGTWIVTLNETFELAERFPRLQVNVPAEFVQDAVLFTNVTPMGNLSVTTTLVAFAGPLFFTPIV
jgi:hypothetical protein